MQGKYFAILRLNDGQSKDSSMFYYNIVTIVILKDAWKLIKYSPRNVIFDTNN